MVRAFAGSINYHRSLDGISSLADVIDVADVLTDRSDLLMLRDILIWGDWLNLITDVWSCRGLTLSTLLTS